MSMPQPTSYPNRYISRPVVIEAIQYTDIDVVDDIILFGGGEIYVNDSGRLAIDTLEGTMTAAIGDYIIKGTSGEFYPCKPDVFELKYEMVE